MKINIKLRANKNFEFSKAIGIGNVLTLKRCEAETDTDLEPIIDVIVSENSDGDIVFLNLDFTYYSNYYEDFISDHELINYRKFVIDSNNENKYEQMNNYIIIVQDQDNDEILKFLCSSNEFNFYLVGLNSSTSIDAEGDFNIDVSEYDSDINILNIIMTEQRYSLIEIIPSEEIEIRRT